MLSVLLVTVYDCAVVQVISDEVVLVVRPQPVYVRMLMSPRKGPLRLKVLISKPGHSASVK